jgi:hypothetical protein
MDGEGKRLSGIDALVVQPERNSNERHIQMNGISRAVAVSAPDLAKLAIEENAMTSMPGRILVKTIASLVLITSVVTYAQTPPSRKSKSDAEKIASALEAGPTFVTQNATVVDYPTSPGGEYRVVRAGTNGWTCLPGFAGAAHDEPGCFDQVFLQFIKDSMAGRSPNVQSIGISYMYGGKWVPNKSHATGSGGEFHVGPHIMIIGLDQKMMQTLNQDGSNGKPYVNSLSGHTELFLVIPIREWDDAQTEMKYR